MPKERLFPNITLATKVTLLRILGIPVFILLMIYYTQGLKAGSPEPFFRYAALGVFLAVALTDALDGYLARSRNEITHLGRMLDPIADKGLLLSALVLLTRPALPDLQPQFPLAVTFLVFTRDILLVAGAALIRSHSGSLFIQPRWTGKVVTVLLMVLIAWSLAGLPGQPFDVLAWLAGGLIAVSGIQYAFDGIRQFEQER